eukprot:TRINITY_DN11116_c1_g1_i1.p1 TRINITY_DN11116_c1_g1~~TRINITY_DN11116_c1_g1_i1.p1  ORF type:complete len:362 (-),score=105.49 TRINITY_DN11116_c1_g1_i1:274-1359(-)
MPRGPGKSANYNLDYSRFNYLDKEEAKEVKAKAAGYPSEKKASSDTGASNKDVEDAMRQMPPELQEAFRLMQLSNQTGDEKARIRANELALKAVERGGPEIQKAFLNEVGKTNPQAAADIGMSMPESSEGESPLEGRIDRLKAEMEAGKDATRKQLEALQAQQDRLENMSSPEEFMKLMQGENGMSNEDIQRMLTGDTEHMERMVKKMLNNCADGADSGDHFRRAEKAVEAAEQIHQSVFQGVDPLEAPDGAAEAEEKAASKEAAKKEEEVQIPNHRLQYIKDDAGKYTAVELTVQLPGVADMGSIALDLSEKHLRLNTTAPRFVVNAGPFPVLIEPSAARAKFSKKKQELSLCVPAKTDR